jgi:hypothetical protein
MTSDLGQSVWRAYAACGDDPNEPASEELGVYSTEEKARKVAALWLRTGAVQQFTVDEVPPWVEGGPDV